VAVLTLLGLPLVAADKDQVRRIQERLMAPCCWQQTVAVHDSDIAKQMRTEIERMVANGESEQQIVDQFVARYGERILSEPRGAKSWWLILVPLITFTLATLGLIAFIFRHRKKGAAAMTTGALPPLDDIDLE